MGAALTTSLSKKTKEVSLTNRNLTAIPFVIPKKNSVVVLDISNNKIHQLPETLKKVQNLNFSGNGLRKMGRKLIQSILVMTQLEVLDLSSNDLDEIPDFLAGFKMLKKLDFGGNKLSKLPPLPNIEILNLSGNRFARLPKVPLSVLGISLNMNVIEVFDVKLPNTKVITMEMNRIRRVMLNDQLANLEVLDLSFNFLEELPDMFAALPKLRNLNVSHNKLRPFPVLPKGVKNVNVSHNQITELPNDLVSYEMLQTLEMDYNKVRALPALPESLVLISVIGNEIARAEECRVPQLTKAIFYDNKFSENPPLRETVFEDGFFNMNCLTRIDVSLFHPTLQRLNLSQNKLKSIPVELFRLPKLIYLNLFCNELETLPVEVKDSGLLYLNISQNPITELDFELPKTLLSFWCSHCGLKSFPPDFGSESSIIYFVACGNRLESVPMMPHVENLILSHNRLKSVPPVSEFLKTLDLSMNEIDSFPKEFRAPKLVEIDLSYNKLTKAPKLLESIDLRSFKLSHNPIVGTFDCMAYPFLDCLDVSYTDITFVDPPADSVREVICSNKALVRPGIQFKLIEQPPYIGYAEMKGERDSMEDSILLNPQAVAVFDGHGGSQTACYAVYRLATEFVDPSEFTEDYVREVIANLIHDIKIQQYKDGATMALALLKDDAIISAHLGDSRVLLISDTGAVRHETKDHKPLDRDEIDRILAMGGRISNQRTGGVLAVARSLGDFDVHGIGYEPVIKTIKLTPSDKWLVVACDGVFDVLTNKEIGHMSRSHNNATEFAYAIRNVAYSRASLDNISVIAYNLSARTTE